MPFSDEDKALIQNLHQFKEYGSWRILAKCSEKTGKGKEWVVNWKDGKQEALTKGMRAVDWITYVEENGVTIVGELAGLLS